MRQGLIVAGVSALTLGVVGYAAFQIFQAQQVLPDVNEQDLDRTYAPPEINTVVETFDTLTVEGDAEPGSIVAVSVDGQRERSLSVNADGQWRMEYGITPARKLEMTVESFLDETPIQGDQTVLRIPAPGAEDGIAQRPLVMVTSPGGPSRIVQTPFGEPLRDGPLELTVIEYDEGGGTVFAGRANPADIVTLSRGDDDFGRVPVGPDGRWFSVVVDSPPSVIRDYSFSDGAGRRISVAFSPLSQDRDLEHAPAHWQVRRELEGGGTQVAVVFANPATPSEEGSDEG